MTGLPAALSALALASTASVADSEIAETRAETLVGMGSIVPPARSAGRVIYAVLVRRGRRTDVHCMNRQSRCRCGSMPVYMRRSRKQCVLEGSGAEERRCQEAEGSSSIGQSPGLQNRWLGVRVPPALRVRSGEAAKPANV